MVAVLFITFIVCLGLGVPVAFSLGLSSLVYFIGNDMSLYMFAQRIFCRSEFFYTALYSGLRICRISDESGWYHRAFDWFL